MLRDVRFQRVNQGKYEFWKSVWGFLLHSPAQSINPLVYSSLQCLRVCL